MVAHRLPHDARPSAQGGCALARRTGAVIAVAAALAGQAAFAQVGYPSALDRETLGAWLRRATDLSPEQVVGVSPSAATAIVSRRQPAGAPAEVLLRAEALKPEAARAGLLAWEMRLEVDCRSGEIRVGGTSGFATRRRSDGGDPVAVAPAEPDWRKPSPGTALEASWRAVCDPSFRPPLAAPALHAAAAAAAPALAPAAPPPLALRPALSPSSPNPAARAARAPRAAGSLPPARRGRGAVQVVSSPLQADAQRSLEHLRSRFAQQLAGLETRVEPAQVRGQTVYRGLVAGFATHGEAEAFCQALRSRGHDCLAR